MNMTGGGLFASLLVSTLGYSIFRYGKKQRRGPQFVAGVVLMVYPYFLPSAGVMLAVGAGIVGLLWVAVRAGW